MLANISFKYWCIHQIVTRKGALCTLKPRKTMMCLEKKIDYKY